jgi:hypothetical protein
MAWMELHGSRYRVRYRHCGRAVVDGVYDTAEAARHRVEQLARLDRAVQRRLRAPAPTVTDWVAAWLPAHLAGPATTARYESAPRVHILPAFGGHRLDAITRNDVKAFARALGAICPRRRCAASSPSSA